MAASASARSPNNANPNRREVPCICNMGQTGVSWAQHAQCQHVWHTQRIYCSRDTHLFSQRHHCVLQAGKPMEKRLQVGRRDLLSQAVDEDLAGLGRR